MKASKLLLLSSLVFISGAFYNFHSPESSQLNEFASGNPRHEQTSLGSAPTIRQQEDDLLEAYEKALQYELENGETVEVVDELGEKTIMLAGESAKKIEALWIETIAKINALSARPSQERADAVESIQLLDGSEDVTYLDRDHSLYDNSVELERYMTAKFVYSIDIETDQVVEISLVDQFNINVDPVFDMEELEEQARKFISVAASEADLNALVLSVGEKSGEIFFFRWEDQSIRLGDGSPAFVQVGYTTNGDLVHYLNTLAPKGQASESVTMVNFAASPALLFSEYYANGGAYWQWVSGSGSTQNNAGYCYIAGWCSPKNFYYKITCYGCTSAKGRWNANPSTTVKASAFIPSTHATTLQACYKTFYNGGASSISHCVNQNIYYNVWVSITPATLYNIKKIELANTQDSSSLKEIGWDETWVYTP